MFHIFHFGWPFTFLPILFMITKMRVVLALCYWSWCFSILFPRHAGFRYRTKATLIHLSMQPSTTKGSGCFSHLAWFPKKAWSVQSRLCVSVLPHSNNFLIPSEGWFIKFDVTINISKPVNSCSVCGGKRRKERIFSILSRENVEASAYAFLDIRIYTRRNSKHRPKAKGPR